MNIRPLATLLFLGLGFAACDSGSMANPDGGTSCSLTPVLNTFATRCSNAGCHIPGVQYPELSANGLPNWIGQNSHEMPALPLITPGNPDGSWLYKKVMGMQGAGGGALMPLGAAMPDTDVSSVIHDWITAGAPTQCAGDGGVTTPAITDPNSLDQTALFTCQASAPPASSVARIRRIDQPEWVHAISTPDGPAGGFSTYQNPFTNQTGAPYSTYAAGQTIDPATLDLFFLNLPEAGSAWDQQYAAIRTYAVTKDSSLTCIFNTVNPTDACIDYFITKYLQVGVLSRAETADEHARLRAYLVAAIGREQGDVTKRKATLDELATAVWLTSGALFRSELGAPVMGDPAGRSRLTNDELALAVGSLFNTHRPGSPMWNGLLAATGNPPYVPPSPDDANPQNGWLQQVRAAADSGMLQDPNVIRSLITTSGYAGGIDASRRDTLFDLLGSISHVPARGEYWLAPRIAGFFREWLGYAGAINAFKDTPGATSQYPPSQPNNPQNPFDPTTLSYINLQNKYYGVDSSLVEQLDDTIARAVLDSAQAHTNVFQALMTTRLWRLPSDESMTNTQACTTAANCTDPMYPQCTALGLCGTTSSLSTASADRVYNLQFIPNTSAGRWVTMSGSERSGVLTHPAWLAAFGDNFEDDASLIHRGHWIRENLFCQTVPGLQNVMVQAMLGPHDPTLSARDRVLAATTTGPNSPTCLGCHGLMNTLGFPFEIYNHAGFVRATDHGHAPNGSTMISNAPDAALNASFNSALDFTQALASSQYAKRCFIRQAFRYFNGRDETLQDSCTLASMENALDNGSFFDMLAALGTSDTFLYRTANGGAQ